jgi:hypothetical protein
VLFYLTKTLQKFPTSKVGKFIVNTKTAPKMTELAMINGIVSCLDENTPPSMAAITGAAVDRSHASGVPVF